MIEAVVKKIREEELSDYIGKKVDTRQLDDILDTYIILTDVEIINNPVGPSYIEGILEEFSKQRLRIKKHNSTLLFNDSFLREECINIEY